MRRVSRFLRVFLGLTLLFLSIGFIMAGCVPEKYKIKDPLEAHERAWSSLDLTMTKNYDVDRFGWFLLRTPEYLDQYFSLLGKKREVTPEEIEKEKGIVQKYLVVEINMETRARDELEESRWKFTLSDDAKNTYTPIAMETSPIAKGEEYIAAFEAYRPVKLVKKSGGVPIESITPTFYRAQTAQDWVRTFVLYFPRNRPNSDVPIVHENTGQIELEAQLKRRVTSTTLRAKWDAGELVRNKEKWREYYAGP